MDALFGPKIDKFKISALNKLHHLLVAKIDGKSNDDSLEVEALKRCLDPEMDLNCLICGLKSKIYNLRAWNLKSDHYFGAKFYGKSNGDSRVARKRLFNPVEVVLQGKKFSFSRYH